MIDVNYFGVPALRFPRGDRVSDVLALATIPALVRTIFGDGEVVSPADWADVPILLFCGGKFFDMV